MRRSLKRMSLLGRFSLLSLLLICAVGLVVGTVLSSRIEHRALADAERFAVGVAGTGAQAALDQSDLAGQIGPSRMLELDQKLSQPLANSGVIRNKIYTLDGTVAYSDDHSQIGSRENAAEIRELIDAGVPKRELGRGTTDNGTGEKTLSVYVPIRVGAATSPNALFEIYQPYGPVAADIQNDTRILILLLALGLAILWASLFRIVSRASRRLHRQAREDHLTGLPNRAALHAAGRDSLTPSPRPGRTGALLLIDLDRFKEVNDTLGHDQGDHLLCEVAQRLREVLRPTDVLARLGGDEFAILIRDLPERSATIDIAGRVEEALRRPFDLAGVAVELGASIGVALYPDHGDDLTTLLRRADVAMYEAKRSRISVCTYDRATDPYSPERLALVAELRTAIKNDELVLHFQPKIEIETGRVAGVEALVRWQHPERGLLAPIEFVPLAERTGLIGAVTRWVLDAALRQQREWMAAGLEMPVAINLSGADVLDTTLAEVIGNALVENSVPGRLLECEISEDTVLADPRRAIESLGRLRAMGVKLSLDDFGQGQSSLSYLKRLPLDEIKIDRSFVMGMGTDDSDAAIVRTTIDLGRNLGLKVVAEGVETDEAYADLAALQCDVAQGFGLSRPLPADELRRWLDERRDRVAA